MKITVNKCRFTGKLFENDKEYRNHLAKIRRQQKAERESKRIRAEWDGWFSKEKESITHPDMIAPWFLKNQKFIMKAYVANCGPFISSHDKVYPETDNFDEDKFSFDLNPFDRVSNTHNCPKNGVTNWDQEDNKPTYYMGWRGKVKGKFTRNKKHMFSYPASKILNFVDLHTGCGGGGNEGWNFEIYIFLDDWPQLGQSLIFDKLVKK